MTLRFLHCLCGLLMFALPAAMDAAPSETVATTAFDTTVAWRHMLVLADDTMRGRDTPSPELERTASYLEATYRRLGLEPVAGTYRHRYELRRANLVEPTTMAVTVGGQRTPMALKSDMVPFDQTGAVDLVGVPLVFAGFGITAAEYGYDDYAGIDVKGKAVVVARGEPTSPTDSLWFAGRRWTRYGSMTEKVRNARQRGAVAVLLIDVPRPDMQPRVFGYPWPLVSSVVTTSSLPLTLPDTTRPVGVIHVGEAFCNAVLGGSETLRRTITTIETSKTPVSDVLADATIDLRVTLEYSAVPLDNVVAMVRGTTYPDEYVIMGAHYDHVGIQPGVPAGGDSICNGADDNASGTTGLLLAAQSMAAAPPQRSVVFISFSGEEKGLLGSKAYVRSPLLPLDRCVAMVNMDMIGRCDSNRLSIGGNTRCPELIAINETVNAAAERPFTLAYDIESYFFRSDQASFAMKKIPVIFYFTGEHKDYHKVTDEASKINMRSLVDISRMATAVAREAAARPRTRYVPAGGEE